MKTTMIELINLMTAKIEEDSTWATAEVDLVGEINFINHHIGEVITLEDDDADDDYCDDVDESNYDPYMGCDFYDVGGFFDEF